MSSRRPRWSRIAVVAAAVVALSSVFAAPAAAIEVVPTPPGWGVTVPGSPGSGGGAQVTENCALGRAYLNGKLYYENWPGCRFFHHNGRRYNWVMAPHPDRVRPYCTHTMEVWRFYGTRANPTQVRTVSRTNLNPCHTTVAPLVHDSHPEDSSRSPYLGLVSPWRAGTAFGAPLVGVQASVALTLGSAGDPRFVFTTNWPFRRNGWCNSLMSRDPNPMTGQQYTRAADSWRRISARWGQWWADVAWDRVGGTHAAPVFGDNGIDCSSGTVDFAVPAQPVPYDQQGDVKISGYCAVPVYREHRRTMNPVTGEYFYSPASRLAASWAASPEVYSTYYGVGSTSNAPTAENTRILNAMRASVADEVGTRQLAGITTPGLYPEDQVRPPWASLENPDTAAAAFVAALFSHCAFTSSNTFGGDGTDTVEESGEELPGDAVRLYVEVPQAGQVGGAHRPTYVRTRLATGPGGAEVRCGDGWCPTGANGPSLVAVHLDTTSFLAAPDGADCRVLQPLRPAARTGTADGASNRLEVAFFKATDAAGGPYRLHVGPSSHAVIKGSAGVERRVTTCEPFGGGCTTHTTSERRDVTREVPVEVVYVRSLATLEEVPPEFPVVGATATPIEGRGN